MSSHTSWYRADSLPTPLPLVNCRIREQSVFGIALVYNIKRIRRSSFRLDAYLYTGSQSIVGSLETITPGILPEEGRGTMGISILFLMQRSLHGHASGHSAL